MAGPDRGVSRARLGFLPTVPAQVGATRGGLGSDTLHGDVEDAGEGGGHLGGGGDNHRETCPHLAWKSRQVAGADSWDHRSPSTDEAGREA